mgnify:CR=1 FL=1
MWSASRQPVTRRRMIAVSTTVAVTALLAACGGQAATSQSAASSSPVATSAAPATSSAVSSAAVSTTAASSASASAAPTAAASTTTASATAATSATSASAAAISSTSASTSSTASVAASTSARAAGAQEITWSCYNLGTSRIDALNKTFQAAQQATGVKVNVVWAGGSDYWDKAQAAFAGGVASADIIVNQDNWVIAGGLSGMFVDVSDYMRANKMDPSQFYKSGLEEWSWKGKQWALPFQEEGEVVFYNKSIFDRKGVAYPKKDWTYDDLLATAQKLNDPTNKSFGIDIGDGRSVPEGMSSYMLAWGGQILNQAKDQALYGSDPKSIAGAQFDVEFVVKWQLGPTAAALQTLPKGKTPFDVSMVALEINDFYRRADIVATIGAANVGYAPMPKGPSGVQSAEVAGNAWSIMSLSKVKDSAWSALAWTLGKEGLLSTPQLQALGWPSIIWAAESPQWMEQFKGSTIKDVSDVWASAGHSILPLPEGDKAWKVMQQPLTDAFSNKISVADAMQQSAASLNNLFAQRPAAWK